MLGSRFYYNHTIIGILFLDEVSKSGTMSMVRRLGFTILNIDSQWKVIEYWC